MLFAIVSLVKYSQSENLKKFEVNGAHTHDISHTGLNGPHVLYLCYICGHLCYNCLVFVMLLCLVIDVLWSPAGKGLTSRLSLIMLNCVFVTFPCGILDQVWYLIVSIPDLSPLSYFK